jgi:hypothetical protein
MNRVLTVTVVMLEEKARDAWMGTSVYATPEALLRSMVADWEHERGFDLQDATNDEDRRYTNETYDSRISSFRDFAWAVNWNDPGPEARQDLDWFCEDEGNAYYFRWASVNK